jgi:hypothetical protein
MDKIARNILEERSHLHRFLENLPDAPVGERDYRDKPDLLIRTPLVTIGIEHTRLYWPIADREMPLQALEALQQRAVELAWEAFEERGGPPLVVHVAFNNRVIRKSEVRDIAARICAVVARFNLQRGEEHTIEGWRLRRAEPDALPVQVDEIWILHPDFPEPESLWGVPRGGAIPVLTKEQLQEEITQKETKLSEYRKICDSLWLLLVADGFTLATHFKLPDDIREMVFASDFDRAFFFHNFDCEAVELELTRRTPL